MPSKLQTFLADNKIDQRQLLAVSHKLESLRAEDRAIRLTKKRGAKSEDAAAKEKAKSAGKGRSGRPLNASTLAKVFASTPVPGPTRTRVLRAVNALLERRKKDKVELSALFDLATEKAKKGKKVEKKKN
jgi:hypothetical protein